MMNNRSAYAVMAAILVVVARLVLVDRAPAGPTVVQEGMPPAYAASLLQQVDPTPTFAPPVTPTRPAWLPEHVDDRMWDGPQPIAGWVSQADAVARVRVGAVGDPLYNTLDGNVPAAEPAGSDFESLNLYRPVKLDVLELFKGDPTRTGFFVAQLGGTRDGYEVSVSPNIEFVEGGEGIVFVEEVPDGEVPEDLHMLRFLVDSDHEYNADDPVNLHHKAAIATNWYFFSGPDATSVVDGRTLPISQLLAEIEDALP